MFFKTKKCSNIRVNQEASRDMYYRSANFIQTISIVYSRMNEEEEKGRNVRELTDSQIRSVSETTLLSA